MLSLKLSLVLVLAVVSANARNIQQNTYNGRGYPQAKLVRTLSGVVTSNFVRQSGGQPTLLSQPVNDAALLSNNCPVGYVQPIWTGAEITETFCRCPDGGYGLTCQENFANPCHNGAQYSPADASIPANYFIECNWNYPYLMKCAPGTVWDQSLYTCNWATTPSVQASSGYGYGQVQAAAPAYGQVQAAAPAYGQVQAAAPAYGQVQAAAPAYGQVQAAAPAYGQVQAAAPAYGQVQAAAPAYGQQQEIVQQQAAPAYGQQAPIVQQQAAPAYNPIIQQQAAPAYGQQQQFVPQQQTFTPTFQSGY